MKMIKKIFTIIRHVSGSGKSTLAKQLAEENSGTIFSTDTHFIVDGEYKFDISKLNENHKKTFLQVKKAMSNSQPYIILDNTNLNGFECIQYKELCDKYQYIIQIESPYTPWNNNPEELHKKNIHGLSKSKIVDQLNNFAPEEVFIENMRTNLNHCILDWVGNLDFSEKLPVFTWRKLRVHYNDVMSRMLLTPQSPIHHPEGTVGEHTKLVLKQLPIIWELRKEEYGLEDMQEYFTLLLSCYLHDSGKIFTTWKRNSENYSHYRHEFYSSRIANKAFDFLEEDKLMFYKETGFIFEKELISELCLHHMFYCRYKNGAKLEKFVNKYNININFFKLLLILTECDTTGRGDISNYTPSDFSILWKEFNGT